MHALGAQDPIRDSEWDQKYFKLILELEEKFESRYEMQASKRKALPHLFAKSEADHLIDLNQ